MKKDVDALMLENKIDVLLVTGTGWNNPFMVYFTGIAHVTGADLVKKRGEEPVLFFRSMERDEAARTGLKTRAYNLYPLQNLLKESGGDPYKAVAIRYQRMLNDLGITGGRIALYGQASVGESVNIFMELQRRMPELEFVGYQEKDVLLTAMSTKDEEEVSRIRRMGKITAEVVGMTREFISGHRVNEDVLVGEDGTPLTIGEVKKRINLWLMERGAENPEGTIFSINRDAGVPHSTGNNSDVLKLGQVIVFDIFPCEAGGGYYYDMTRTWCLGYAPKEVQRLYDQVFTVHQQVIKDLKMNAPFGDYQKLACEIFEDQGHATIINDPVVEEGYVHSLGHGVGLHIHERPNCGWDGNSKDTLRPGSIFTVEPGLYYPDRGMGMRLEDTIYAAPDGTFEILADCPLDLVLPIKGK